MREDGIKVYFKIHLYQLGFEPSTIDTDETLQYDFNLQAGDTSPLGHLILRTDSILLNGSYRKRYITSEKYSDDTVTYIEGVGSNMGLVFTRSSRYTRFIALTRHKLHIMFTMARLVLIYGHKATPR